MRAPIHSHMASTDESPEGRPESDADGSWLHGCASYWKAAREPLQILAFLLPFIVAYEICLALVLPTGDGLHVNTVEAHRSLLRFFAVFGIAPAGGLYLGGLVIVVVLVAWHVMVREPWRVRTSVVGFMAAESLVLAVPLVVLGHVIVNHPLVAAVPPGPGFGDLDRWSQMAISVGAGLYEELAFRMILIALLHTLLVDLAKMPDFLGTSIAIVVSAVAFTMYHDLRGPDGSVATPKVLFFLAAGTYFGVVYSLRGFGLVVGCHAVYDVITVLLAAEPEA